MKCERCGRGISQDQTYSHLGETLCDDCYLDVRWPVTSCDSRAADSADEPERSGFRRIEGLTGLQAAIYRLIESKGQVTWEELAENLSIRRSALHDPLAALKLYRLVEDRKEGGRVYLILAASQEAI